jgi:DNA-binding NarL/FixJ family response regulator
VRRLLIVDDEPKVLALLERHFAHAPEFEVCARATTGAEALAAASQHHPNTIVLDLGLPDVHGAALLPMFRRIAPEARIIVYSADERAGSEAMEAGADGFLAKGGPLEQLDQLLS